jgi:hypothetical protein
MWLSLLELINGDELRVTINHDQSCLDIHHGDSLELNRIRGYMWRDRAMEYHKHCSSDCLMIS